LINSKQVISTSNRSKAFIQSGITHENKQSFSLWFACAS
jgi:hypothetical protein